MSEKLVSVRKDDLDILVAACTSHLPDGTPQEVAEAFARLLGAWDDASAAPASEPAKVIVVTETGGRERRFAADSWDRSSGDGALDVHRTSREEDPIVAHYTHGAWLSVREDGAEVPDATAKALGIAKAALEEIQDEPHVGFGPERARKALDEIFAETGA